MQSSHKRPRTEQATARPCTARTGAVIQLKLNTYCDSKTTNNDNNSTAQQKPAQQKPASQKHPSIQWELIDNSVLFTSYKTSQTVRQDSSTTTNATVTAPQTVRFGAEITTTENAAVDLPETENPSVMAFDLDHTLIFPSFRRKAKFQGGLPADWQWGQSGVVLIRQKIIDALNREGHQCLCIFSNQKYVNSSAPTFELHVERIKDVMSAVLIQLDLPILVFFSLIDDINRKPRNGFLAHLVRQAGKEFNWSKSVFIGDAAGRKNDFADTDLKFALNAGMLFKTPETFFANRISGDDRLLPLKQEFDPRKLPLVSQKPYLCDLIQVNTSVSQKEALILVGSPGSGKTFLGNYLKTRGYIWVNQDTLKTRGKVQSAFKQALLANVNVVVDRQNFSRQERQTFIKEAKAHSYLCRAIQFKLSSQYVRHCDSYRVLARSNAEHKTAKVPQVAIFSYFKHVEPPTTGEAFDAVVVINEGDFAPGPFNLKEEEQLFRSFLA